MKAMQSSRNAQKNNSIIHPPGFYIDGFPSLPYIDYYIMFLIFVYVTTVLSNSFVICMILSDYRLKTPKFVAVGNLAVVDVMLSSTIIPNMVKTFLIKDNFMPFQLCFVQMFFYYVFCSLESISLGILAYDRFIAICFPLWQKSINTVTSMFYIVATAWTLCICVVIFSTKVMDSLSFCGSVIVKSYFCDYAPVFRLACNDFSMQWAIATYFSILLLFGPLSFIIFSYLSILIAVFRMKNVISRNKAIATCTEHLILVAVFYIPVITIFMIGFFTTVVNADLRVLSLSLASCIPPCLNPIIYSLKTKEIRSTAFPLFTKYVLRVQRPGIHPLKINMH